MGRELIGLGIVSTYPTQIGEKKKGGERNKGKKGKDREIRRLSKKKKKASQRVLHTFRGCVHANRSRQAGEIGSCMDYFKKKGEKEGVV